MGILLGYFLFVKKKKATQNGSVPDSTKKPLSEKIRDLVCLAGALALLGLILLGPHGDFAGYPLNRTANLLYQATCRNLWTIGLAYIIYACLTSRAG